jgi:hypothetical protein
MTVIQENEKAAFSREFLVRQYLSYALAIALALTTGWAVMKPFHSRINWMNFEQDDFFYYLKVASNIASGRGSTFNGLVSTNGYHPLWMWTLALIVRLGSGVRFVPAFLSISIWLATMTTFLLSRHLLLRTGVDLLAAAALSTYMAVYAMHVFSYGMEVTLAVPLMFGLLVLLEQDTWWSAQRGASWPHGVAIGLMTTLMVLSRLDTLIFASLIVLGILLQSHLRHRMRPPLIAGVALGLLPLTAYFIANRMLFGIWMPVSGMAKQLKLDHGFTSLAWKSLFSKSPVQLLNLVPILLALAALPWLWRRLPLIERAFIPAALSFPFVYIALLSWLSDWQLWGWYFYMLRPALLVAFLLFLRTKQLKRILAWPPLLVFLVLVAFTRIKSLELIQQQPDIVAAAREVQEFSLAHPGIYAMGDRSGAVGYLLNQPIVQTEGLMMDHGYLNLISQQLPLRAVLERYGVRYYVGTAMKPFTGCFEAKEPAQAGPHAPHLGGEFCEQPIAQWTFAGVKTMVFDLENNR